MSATDDAPGVDHAVPISHPPEPLLARWLNRLERAGISPGVASAILVAGVLLQGLALERAYSLTLLTTSTVMALLWLGIGPLLIRDAVRVVDRFLHGPDLAFVDPGTPARLHTMFLAHWRKGSMVFSLPWAIFVTSLVLRTIYATAPPAVLFWAAVSFGLLFFMSGSGFWGVMALVKLVRTIAKSDIIYRPYHPDRFGGMGVIGSFSVRGALYFSSGALVLPLAFEIVGASTPSGGLSSIAYLATAIFIAFVGAAFVVPIIDIKGRADAERLRVSLDARNRLHALMDAYHAQPQHDEKLSRQADMCFQMECAELEKLREYPYDMRVLGELLLAVAVPVLLVVLEAVLS